jgi:hypothetical protein
MNRIRNTLPSSESQNPSTCQRLLRSSFSNQPVRLASTKGLLARGHDTFAVTSTKSYASMALSDCLNVTFGSLAQLHAVSRIDAPNRPRRRNRSTISSLIQLFPAKFPANMSKCFSGKTCGNCCTAPGKRQNQEQWTGFSYPAFFRFSRQ